MKTVQYLVIVGVLMGAAYGAYEVGKIYRESNPKVEVGVNDQLQSPTPAPAPLDCSLDDTFGRYERSGSQEPSRSYVLLEFKEAVSNSRVVEEFRRRIAFPANFADMDAYARDLSPENQPDTGIVAIMATWETKLHKNPGVFLIRKRMSQASERCPTARIQWTIEKEVFNQHPNADDYPRWAAGTRFLGVLLQ